MITQAFEIETDDMDIIENVLSALLPSWFSRGKKEFRCHTQQQSVSFNSGSLVEDRFSIFNYDNKTSVICPRCVWHGAVSYGSLKTFTGEFSMNEAAEFANKKNSGVISKPSRMLVASISGPYSEPERMDDVLFGVVADVISHIVKSYNDVDRSKFETECQGAPDWFDGSSQPGYRLAYSNGVLDASLCTILYGK